MANPFIWLRDNFGKAPEPKPPMIPGPWRIPFFIALSVAALIALIVLTTYVIIPGIQAQQQSAPVPVEAPTK